MKILFFRQMLLLSVSLGLCGCYSLPYSHHHTYGYPDPNTPMKVLRIEDETPDQKQTRLLLTLISGMGVRRVMAQVPGDTWTESLAAQYNVNYRTNRTIRSVVDEVLEDEPPIVQQQISTAIGSVAASGKVPLQSQLRGACLEYLKHNCPDAYESARAGDFFISFVQRLAAP